MWNYFWCITTYLITMLQHHGYILTIFRHLQYQWLWISLRGHPRSLIFCINRKHVCDFLLHFNKVNNNLGPILPRFRDIRAFICRKPLFRYPSPIPAKFQGVPVGVDPLHLGCKERTPRLTDGENYFWRFPTYVIMIHVTDGQTDGQMTCYSITALCVASCGKNQFIAQDK